jgi:hypothetical protein
MKKVEIGNMPIFVTNDVKSKNDHSSLYLLDMDNIEIPICDCILYDRNGNPKCSLHKGRLQEFYDPSEVISLKMLKHKKTYHLIKDNLPYCNFKKVDGQEFIITTNYVNCKNCLKRERSVIDRRIEAHKLISETSDNKYFFKTEGFDTVGKIKDVQ